jgi:hypothetical protein
MAVSRTVSRKQLAIFAKQSDQEVLPVHDAVKRRDRVKIKINNPK